MTKTNGFSERLRTCRAEAGLTQRELSEKSGVAVPQISRYEKGINTPRGDIALQLANALNVDFEWFMYGERKPQWKVLAIQDKPFIKYNDTEAVEEFIPVITQLLKILADQKKSVLELNNEVANPFSKFEIRQTSTFLSRAQAISARVIEALKNVSNQVIELERSIQDHEKKYLLMEQLGKLDQYYQEQKDFAAYTVSYIMPKEISLELLNISSKDEAENVVEGFKEWAQHLEIPEHLSKKEAYNELDIAIGHLSLTAHIISASTFALEALSDIRRYINKIDDDDDDMFSV